MQQTLLPWLSSYGSLALFFLLALGIFGLPVPSETLLLLAGALVDQGDLRLAPTVAAAVLGSSLGITVSYTVGRLVGPPAVHTFGRLVHLSDDALPRLERWFERVGKWTLTFGYYIPGVRHVTAIVAGASRLPLAIFSLFAYSGAAMWSVTFLTVGYEVGARWPEVMQAAHRHIVAAAVVVLVLLVGWGWWQRRR